MKSLFLILCSGCLSAHAALVQLEATTSVVTPLAPPPGVGLGDPTVVRILVDNGAPDITNQVWSPADFLSISFTINGGVYTLSSSFIDLGSSAGIFQTDPSGLVVTAPGGPGWNSAVPVPISDSLGNLTGRWGTVPIPPHITSTSPFQNVVLRFDSLVNPAVWTATVVPEPASASLLALAGLGLLARRRRRAETND